MLEIHIVGTANSGKSTIAKLISCIFQDMEIPHIIEDELNEEVKFDFKSEDIDSHAKKILAICDKYPNGIPIKMIQTGRNTPDENKSTFIK